MTKCYDIENPELGLRCPFTDDGVVVAWGHVDAVYEGEEYERWCVLVLLDPEHRISNVENYSVRYIYPFDIPDNSDRVEIDVRFPNIVPAVEAYADMGMDY